MTFYFEGGVMSFVRHLNKNRKVVHTNPIYIERKVGTSVAEIALQYNDSFSESVFSFANNIHTVDGGAHLTGFRGALTRTLNDYARKSGILKDQRRQPHGRRRARRSDRHRVGAPLQPPVRGPDQGQAEQRRDQECRRAGHLRRSPAVPGREPQRRQAHRREVAHRSSRPRRRPQGPRRNPQGGRRVLHSTRPSLPTAPSATRPSRSCTS